MKNHRQIGGDFYRNGGPKGIRTLDLSDANRTLSQLSYGPVYRPRVSPNETQALYGDIKFYAGLPSGQPALPAELQAKILIFLALGRRRIVLYHSFPACKASFFVFATFFVGLSMMCYTLGKAERTCRGERQARGLIGNLLY